MFSINIYFLCIITYINTNKIYSEDNMVLDNLEVRHKAFGDGVVISASGQYFTVKFDSCQKVFVYPDIFE